MNQSSIVQIFNKFGAILIGLILNNFVQLLDERRVGVNFENIFLLVVLDVSSH